MTCRSIFVLIVSLAIAAQGQAPNGNSGSFRIAGTITDSLTGQPISNAAVSIAASENPEFSRHMTTGPDGHFVFTAIPAGKYTLVGSAYGYRAQGYHQHGDYFIGLAVGRDLDFENVSFWMTRDARIEGTVTDDESGPIRNASVQLFRRTNETGRQQTREFSVTGTDDRGHYLFGHLAPGTYFVAVSARPWFAQYFNLNELSPEPENAERVAEERAQLDIAYPLTFYPSVTDSTGATPLILRPGDQATADITLRAESAVHLRVKSNGQTDPKAGITSFRVFPRVSQRIFDGTLISVMSSQSSCEGNRGCDLTGIAPGHYIIEMTGAGNHYKRGWFKEMDLSGTVELDPSESPPLAAVSGAILFEGGRPSGRIDIVLINRATDEMLAAEVTPQATFDFKDSEVRPGAYDVALNIAQGTQISSLQTNGARVNGKTLNLTGGSVQLTVTATRSLARINGTVLRDDKPFAGAMVVLIPRDPVSDLIMFRRDESDSDGTFSLRDVLPGTYIVIALDNGWDLDWANPATLAPYMKNGLPVDISGETRLNIKVPLQQ